MQDYNFTNTTEDYTCKDKDMSGPPFDWEACYRGVVMVVACVGLPPILLAIYGLYKEVREERAAAPLYLINLLVSDLLQICSSAALLVLQGFISGLILSMIYSGGVLASVGFMVCISVQRYLLVAFPLWYRFRRNIRNSVIVCLLVWLLSIVTAIPPSVLEHELLLLPYMVFLLLPFPVFIFSLVGTLKALLASVSVSRKEKQKIVTVLVLVLFNYTLLFLPFITWLRKALDRGYHKEHYTISRIFLQLSPVVDLLLYVFMRKGTLTKLRLALRCCTKTPDSQAPQEEGDGEEGGVSQGAELGHG